jgi:hypothetical protein
MANWLRVVLVISVVYAVFGNVAVYLLLLRRHVPMKSLWAGAPGYLYRLTPGGTALRRFALTTNVAFVVAIFCGMFLAGERS